jgi:hypothetical protein
MKLPGYLLPGSVMGGLACLSILYLSLCPSSRFIAFRVAILLLSGMLLPHIPRSIYFVVQFVPSLDDKSTHMRTKSNIPHQFCPNVQYNASMTSFKEKLSCKVTNRDFHMQEKKMVVRFRPTRVSIGTTLSFARSSGLRMLRLPYP